MKNIHALVAATVFANLRGHVAAWDASPFERALAAADSFCEQYEAQMKAREIPPAEPLLPAQPALPFDPVAVPRKGQAIPAGKVVRR